MKIPIHKHLLLLLILLTSSQYTFSQMQAAHWVFGKGAHIEFPFGNLPINLNFPKNKVNENTPYIIPPLQPPHLEGSANISDVNGNLLLYTNGEDVYNKYDEKINNRKLKGVFSATQSSIFLPYPDKYNQYILFTTFNSNIIAPKNDLSYFDFGLYYYIIDLNKNNGKGELIIPENNRLMNRVAEKINATFHSNGKDIWLVTHYEDQFYSFLITNKGVETPIISKTNYYSDPKGYSANAKGYLKLSPNGKKLAIAHQQKIDLYYIEEKDILDPKNLMGNGADFYTETVENAFHRGYLGMYDFDNETGKIKNESLFDYNLIFYGLEFSPSSEYLYFQYHTKDYSDESPFIFNTNIILQAEVKDLTKYKLVYDYINDDNSYIFNRGAMQLGVNGKIYHAINTKKLSTIDNPNNTINQINFKSKNQSINSEGETGIGLPNFISNYLKEELKVLNSFDGINACLGTPLKFWVNNNQTITNIHWDFGDGEFSNDVIPQHTYKVSGTYNVKCTINGTIYTKTIIIHDPINLPTYNMIECDADGDGTTGFDLQNFVDFIGSRATYITFHQSENDALSNINSIEENNYKFQGNSSLNSIWARIIGAGGCITFTEITFKINSTSVIPKTETLCKTLINNEYYISLESLANLIGIGDIMVFNNLSDADLLLNQITNDILVNVDLNNKNLFIRKRNFEDCDDIIELKLNLLNPTIINIPKISALCPFEGSITFNIENNSDITSIIWKNEAGETIQTTNTISISEEGKYSVTVINKNNCSTTEYFEVTRSSPIEITYIIDKSKSLIINYGVLDSNNYLFSIDKGGTWHNGTTLFNLPLGSYELWIKENNENACIVYKNIIKNDLITNFFSPNGDGKNDKWIINGFEKYEWIDIQIFNRYGKLIFKNKINASNVIWDGKVNGITQPNGSYWYILKASNNEQYDGYVILKTK